MKISLKEFKENYQNIYKTMVLSLIILCIHILFIYTFVFIAIPDLITPFIVKHTSYNETIIIVICYALLTIRLFTTKNTKQRRKVSPERKEFIKNNLFDVKDENIIVKTISPDEVIKQGLTDRDNHIKTSPKSLISNPMVYIKNALYLAVSLFLIFY